MLIRIIIGLSMMALTISSCGHPRKQKPTDIVIPIDTRSFDSTVVLADLRLNKQDSLFIHHDMNPSSTGSNPKEIIGEETISPQRVPFDFRSVISVYQHKNDSCLCSYVVLYERAIMTSTINRIRQDSLEVPLGAHGQIIPKISFVDINFDGFKDMLISFNQSSIANSGFYQFWTYNSPTETFEEDSALNNMFHNHCIVIDGQKREICTGGNAMGTNDSSHFYRWNGKQYELYAVESTRDDPEGASTTHMREELIGGQWKVVSSITKNKGLFSQIDKKVIIPPKIMRDLNEHYENWRFPRFSEQTARWYNSRSLNPFFIEGDFDGNGQLDVCLHVAFDNKKENYQEGIVLVYLTKDSTFEKHVLETGQTDSGLDINIDLIERGTKGRDLHGKTIFYKYDSINVGFDEKGSSSYTYSAGHFIEISTGD